MKYIQEHNIFLFENSAKRVYGIGVINHFFSSLKSSLQITAYDTKLAKVLPKALKVDPELKRMPSEAMK